MAGIRGLFILSAITIMMAAIATKLVPFMQDSSNLQVATVSAGCFWGVEHIYRKNFLGKGLIETEVGYTGGDKSKPTYEEVCTSNTKHAEGVQLLYDPSRVSYETLIDFFFRIHDPTTANRQGPDVGSQYRSAIFTHSDEQQKIAEAVRDRFQKTFWRDQIVTDIQPIKNWWDAETYHQQYLEKNPHGYECPTHYVRTEPHL